MDKYFSCVVMVGGVGIRLWFLFCVPSSLGCDPEISSDHLTSQVVGHYMAESKVEQQAGVLYW